MTYRGIVRGRTIELVEEPPLPEGTEVEVSLSLPAPAKAEAIAMACADLAGATAHAAIGPQYEANPLMRVLFETSIPAAVAFKVAVLVWFTWAVLAYARVNYRLARVPAISAAALYAVPAAFYAGLACAYGYLVLAVRQTARQRLSHHVCGEI